MEDAKLVKTLSKASSKLARMESPDKVYLDNPNQLLAISANEPEIGTIRETFFLSMLSQNHTLNLPIQGDFLVDNLYLFEIGGKKNHSIKFNRKKIAF